MSVPLSALLQQEQTLRLVWVKYQAHPSFAQFVVFSSLLTHLTDTLTTESQAGLLYACRQLEQKALALFGDEHSHPIPDADMEYLGKRVVRLGELMRYYADKEKRLQRERRLSTEKEAEKGTKEAEREKDRDDVVIDRQRVYLIGGLEGQGAWHELAAQLGYFGVDVRQGGWRLPEADDADLSVYLADVSGQIAPERLHFLQTLRKRRPMARIVCLNVPDDFTTIHRVLQSGVDHCLSSDVALQQILALVLGQKGNGEQESYRVLVVEDSPTAARAIRNNLEEHGIRVHELRDPSFSLQAIRQFQPDLILMDMYMPYCTGVEAAQVIRQHDEFLSIPIVYLSGESNVGLQVAALRLGGDQFLTKPFNPVLMNAVIKSKIDRYRALRHSMENDSLTDLLNHISSKQTLSGTLEKLPPGHVLDVAMLDIDHFKKVNDTHGHQVGDQVIRSLAWLLKQRLRHGDIVGRYGGEEFVLGLVNKTPGCAVEVLDRIREDFQRIPFTGTGGAVFHVSFSAGVATHRADTPMHLEFLLEAADGALYEAKRQGRNRIIMA
ncbi:MAG: diguanylate cyclase [Zoogloeaceae bacterium]|jgi:diguanylate cyclase (GGDEF)-like protein|nr:diguanylate cyclase [Zoogloeaceae bacterium]